MTKCHDPELKCPDDCVQFKLVNCHHTFCRDGLKAYLKIKM